MIPHKTIEDKAIEIFGKCTCHSCKMQRDHFAIGADWMQLQLHGLKRDGDGVVRERPKQSDFDECCASGQSCDYGPHGPNNELQCRNCGKSKGK